MKHLHHTSAGQIVSSLPSPSRMRNLASRPRQRRPHVRLMRVAASRPACLLLVPRPRASSSCNGRGHDGKPRGLFGTAAPVLGLLAWRIRRLGPNARLFLHAGSGSHPRNACCLCSAHVSPRQTWPPIIVRVHETLGTELHSAASLLVAQATPRDMEEQAVHWAKETGNGSYAPTAFRQGHCVSRGWQ